MRLSKRTIMILFAVGCLSCASLVCLWHFAARTASSLHDDVFNGRLKIKLARKLRQDKDASSKLAELLSGCKLIRWCIDGMEEDIRGHEDAWAIYDRLYEKTFLEIAVRLAQFAREHPDTTAALTAKLIYTDVMTFTGGIGAWTPEEDNRRSENSDLFLKEIVNQHPKTWQAAKASFNLIRVTSSSDEEEIRLKQERLEKLIVEPNQADPDFDSYCQWFNVPRYRLRASLLRSLAICQYNLGTAQVRRDRYWLKEAKKTYEQLVKECPEYSKRHNFFRNTISEIDEMLASESETQH